MNININLNVCIYLCLWFGVNNVSSWYEDDEEPKPTFLTANVGDNVVFNCELDFPHDIPIPYILKWNKDGKGVFQWQEGSLSADESFVGRINLVDSGKYGKGSVNLTNIRVSDHGWYQCQVLFPNRNPSTRNNGTWFFLAVNVGNLLETPPVNVTTLEGQEATFICIAKDPKNITIVWYKDGVPLQELSDIKSRSHVSEISGTLTIRSTTMTDLGEYECEANHFSGDKQTARVYLNVQYKAKVVYAPKEIYLPYGRSAILDCHFRSNPPLTNLRWEKDGFLFDPYNVQGVYYRRNGSLYFSRVDETHSGLYSCTPYNDLGTDGPSSPTRVIVQRPPVFIITPNNLYLKKLGETLEMACDARDGDGGHKPTIIWYRKDSLPLPDGRHNIEGGNLTILNIQESDHGLYQCSASNEAATITTETELMVEAIAPRAPYNLTGTPAQNSVTLRWIAGYSRPHTEYSIWYRPLNTEEWRTIKLESRRKLEVTVHDLNPGRTYEFMVISKDKYGDGTISKTLLVTTKGTASTSSSYYDGATGTGAIITDESFIPIGPPKNVTLRLTLDGYVVTWEPPDLGRILVKSYIVTWFESRTDQLCGTIETNDLYLNLRNLEEDTTYNIQVLAVSVDDYQAASDIVVLTVPAYRRIRAISMAIMGAVALLGIAFAIFYYARKKCYQKQQEQDQYQNDTKTQHNNSKNGN